MLSIEVYHYTLCPFSRKLRLLLKENNFDFTLVQEAFWERRRKFVMLTPACETPTIVIDNQFILWGNQTITEYICELIKEKAEKINVNFLPSNLMLKAQVRKITEWFDIKFYQEVTRYIFNEKILKTVARKGYPDSKAIQIAKTNILYHLNFINHLIKNTPYLTGEEISIADFAAAAQLSVLDYVGDVPWESYQAVSRWYALIKSRPSFKPIRQDRIANFPPPLHYSNPDF